MEARISDDLMPILKYVPQDPTDLVLQGEQLRQSVFDPIDIERPSSMIGGFLPSGLRSIVQDDDAFAPMNSFICLSVLSMRRMKSNTLQRRANAGVATPCGAWVSADFPPLLTRFEQASDVFTITGQTVTGAGAALAGCRVVVYETGRIAVTAVPPEQYHSAGNTSPGTWESPSPVVAEAISDGSGNFSILVPMNVAYQLTGYLTGSPDRAGITKDTVVPTAASTLIYLRDPTAPDSGGPGGSGMSRGRVTNA